MSDRTLDLQQFLDGWHFSKEVDTKYLSEQIVIFMYGRDYLK